MPTTLEAWILVEVGVHQVDGRWRQVGRQGLWQANGWQVHGRFRAAVLEAHEGHLRVTVGKGMAPNVGEGGSRVCDSRQRPAPVTAKRCESECVGETGWCVMAGDGSGGLQDILGCVMHHIATVVTLFCHFLRHSTQQDAATLALCTTVVARVALCPHRLPPTAQCEISATVL